MRKYLPAVIVLLGCPPPIDSSQLPSLAPTSSAALTSDVSFLDSSVSVAIVIDTSGSMSSKLDVVKQALNNVIIPQLEATPKCVYVSMILCGGYSAEVKISNSLWTAETFKQSVAGLHADGGTPLTGSLLEAYKQLAQTSCQDRHIFILSDGASNDGDPASVITAMREKGGDTVSVYVIGFLSDRSYYSTLEAQGCTVIMVEDSERLKQTCEILFKEEILKVEEE